ncbi:MAG: hypothetical protein WCJ63_01065 [Actinomycetes bacterium]
MNDAEATDHTALKSPRSLRAGLGFALAIFAGLSLTVVGVVLWNVIANGAHWSGALGYVFDSMQYLAWIREGSDHVLSGNLFWTEPPIRDYLNPGLIISSGLHLLGLSIPLSYAFWVPVGIILVCWAVVKYVGDFIPSGWGKVAAVALALLYKIPIHDLLQGRVPSRNLNAVTYAGFDAWPVYWSWGFSLTGVAVALLCGGLLVYDRVRNSGKRFSVALAAMALLCSWLQPWQGATLLAVVIGGEILGRWILGRDSDAGLRGRLTLLGSTAVFGILPLVYYAILGKYDEAWRINGIQANNYVSGASWWTAFAILGPLLLGAATALRFKPKGFRDIAIRIWPVIAIVQLIVIQSTQIGNTATHALKGITVPLATLTVIGVGPWLMSIGRKTSPILSSGIAIVLIGLLFVPGAIDQVKAQVNEMQLEGRGGYFIAADNERALDFIAASPRKGGVYASSLQGSMVPWRSDRNTWVGHETWTPRFQGRSYFNEQVLVGALPAEANGLSPAAVVRWTGASFVLQDCYHTYLDRFRPHESLRAQLAPITKSVHQFGCATVYEIVEGPRGPAPAGIDRYHLDWTKADG